MNIVLASSVHFARMIYIVYHLVASPWSSCLLPKSLRIQIY